MADTFLVACGVFRGHAVENHFVAQSAPAPDRSDAGASSHSSKALPTVWRQPPDCLQMVEPISSARFSRIAQPIATAAPIAWPIVELLAPSPPAGASHSSSLGGQKDSSAVALAIPAPPTALRPHRS